MGDASDLSTSASIRVAINTAWLEVLIDGEDTQYATLYGHVMGAELS